MITAAKGVSQGVYAIIGSTPNLSLPLIEQCSAAIKGGAAIIQYREKDLSFASRCSAARSLRGLCFEANIPFIINDDVQLCLAIDADGVHLGQEDTPSLQAREILGPSRIIGITCHNSLKLAKQAEKEGADYVSFGAFFDSPTKPFARRAPLSLLREAKQQLCIPIIAIGGITIDNASILIEHGADIIAIANGIFGQSTIEQNARDFAKLFKKNY